MYERKVVNQQYEDRIVAFVDILGFKDLVMQSQSDNKVLQNITSALSSLYDWIWKWEADDYGFAMFCLLVSPAWIKKIAYRVLR